MRGCTLYGISRSVRANRGGDSAVSDAVTVSEFAVKICNHVPCSSAGSIVCTGRPVGPKIGYSSIAAKLLAPLCPISTCPS